MSETDQRQLAGRIGVDQTLEPLDHLPGVIELVPSDPPAEQQPGLGLDGRPDPGFAELGFDGMNSTFLLRTNVHSS